MPLALAFQLTGVRYFPSRERSVWRSGDGVMVKLGFGGGLGSVVSVGPAFACALSLACLQDYWCSEPGSVVGFLGLFSVLLVAFLWALGVRQVMDQASGASMEL